MNINVRFWQNPITPNIKIITEALAFVAPNHSAISHCAVGQLAESQCMPIVFTGHSFWIDKQLLKLRIINVWNWNNPPAHYNSWISSLVFMTYINLCFLLLWILLWLVFWMRSFTKVSFADLHSYQKQLQTIQTFKTEAIII